MEVAVEGADVLPTGWKQVQLGDLLDGIIGGGTPSRNVARYWNGDIPWITVKDMRTTRPEAIQEYITQAGVDECATNIIPGDTVITATRVGLGKVVRVPYPAAINQDLKALIVGPKLDKSYLEWWILANANYIESIGSGTTVKGIRLNQLKELEIPLAPLPEQRRIVGAIERHLGRLDAAVARLHAAKAKLKRYKQAVLKAAYSEGDWPVKSIGDVYEVFVGSTPSRSKPALWNGNINWVSSGEVAFCDIHETKERITEEGLGNRSTRLHPSGTVMLAMIGEGKTRGQSAILRVPASHNQNTAAIRMPNEASSPEYLYYFFMYEYENTRRVGSGNNQMALNKTRIQAIELPLPEPQEQVRVAKAIMERFIAIDETEATLDLQLLQATRLRQAVLKRAFEGRLV